MNKFKITKEHTARVREVHTTKQNRAYAFSILRLIRDKSKNYGNILFHGIYLDKYQKYKHLASWVLNNTLTTSTSNTERCYSAIFQDNGICKNGRQRHVPSFSLGFVRCGHQSTCPCSLESTAKNVSITLLSKTDEEKAETDRKRRATMVLIYGYEYNSQRPEIKLILKKCKLTGIAKQLLYDTSDWLYQEYVVNKRTSVSIARELKVHNSTVLEYCIKYKFDIRSHSNVSVYEEEIMQWLNNLDIDFIDNLTVVNSDRTLLSGKREIDIYIPECKLGIEVNGLHYYSYSPNCMKGQNVTFDKHLNKTNDAIANDIRLLHFTDWEWDNRQDIIKNLILRELGSSLYIDMADCKLVEVEKDYATEFMNNTHVYGFIDADMYIGVVHKTEKVLLQVSAINEFHILRTSSYGECTVVNGIKSIAEYLLDITNKTANDFYDEIKVTAEVDLHLSYGQEYIDNNFKIIEQTHPEVKWVTSNKPVENVDLSKTDEELYELKYRRYYTSGKYILEYN
jgi:hypothetical protein